MAAAEARRRGAAGMAWKLRASHCRLPRPDVSDSLPGNGVAATALAGRRGTHFCSMLQLPPRLFLTGSRKGRLEAWITPTQSAKMLREGCEKGRRVIPKLAKARGGECRALALLVLESAQ